MLLKYNSCLCSLLLILLVAQSDVHHTCDGGHGRKKNNVDKDNLDGPDDRLEINQKLDLENN